MKIKKVKWNQHPILGDLELDFTNGITGEPFDTIVFVGENGTGKTTILETISSFLNIGSFEYFSYIEYVIEDKIYSAIPTIEKIDYTKDFFDILNHENNSKSNIRSNHVYIPESIKSNTIDPRYYGCVFSKARADYKTEQIVYTTTKHLDSEKYDTDNEDNFTTLKQLIVDIQHQDDSDYSKLNQSAGMAPVAWPTFYPNSKIYRFKNAFDNFFEKIKYIGVIDNKDYKSILFKKNDKDIPIDNLSTGEKQIVFRGIYLLRNSKILDGSTIFIDEPELSMHPKWQQRILTYYRNLYMDATTHKQKAQLFFATHSEHVLEKALSDKNNTLVIVLKDNNGII